MFERLKYTMHECISLLTRKPHEHVQWNLGSVMHSTLALKPLERYLTLKVLVATIDAQWEGMGDVGSARYEPALLPPCPTIRVLSYSN